MYPTNSSDSYLACDIFNQIWRLHVEETGCIHFSLFFSNPTWKIETIHSFDSFLVVSCRDGNISLIRDSKVQKEHTLPVDRIGVSILRDSDHLLVVDDAGDVYSISEDLKQIARLGANTSHHHLVEKQLMYMKEGALYKRLLSIINRYVLPLSSESSHSLQQESFIYTYDYCKETHQLVVVCVNGSVIETQLGREYVSKSPLSYSTLQSLHSASSAYKRLSLEGNEMFDTLARREAIRRSLSTLPDHLTGSWSLLSNGCLLCRVPNLSFPQGVTCVQLCVVGTTGDSHIVSQTVEDCSKQCQFIVDHIPVILAGICEASIRLIATLDSSTPLIKEIALGSISMVDVGVTSRLKQPNMEVLSLSETLPVLSSLSRSDALHLIPEGLSESMKIGSVQLQVVTRGSNHTIILQSPNQYAILEVRTRLLQAMLTRWKSDRDGWPVNLVMNQALLDTCISRLQGLELLSESTSFSDAVKELLDINRQLSSLLESYLVCS